MWSKWLLAMACVAALSATKGPKKKGNKKNSAPRITSDSVQRSGMGLKTQLQLVRAVKKAAAAPTPVAKSKKGPSKKQEEEEDDDWSEAEGYSLDPILLVDGYNVIFGTPGLKDMVEHQSLAAARERLEDSLQTVGLSRGYDVVVVYDGNDNVPDTPSGGPLDVVFTRTGETADSVIEKRTYDRRDLGETYVASNDGLVRLMSKAHGAQVMTVEDLAAECEAVAQAVAYRLQAARAVNSLPQYANPTLECIAQGVDSDGNFDLGIAMKRKLIGDDRLAELVEEAQQQSNLHRAYDRLLVQLGEQAPGPYDAKLLEALKELEMFADANGDLVFAKDHLQHQKLLFGLRDLIPDDWHQTLLAGGDDDPPR